MYELAGLYLLIAGLFVLADWRRGLPIVVLTTIVQDPIRKLTPQQPVALSLMAGAVAVITLLVSLRSPRPKMNVRKVDHSALRAAAFIFIGIIVLQAFNGYFSHGSIGAVSLGIISYAGALPAILVGRHLAEMTGERAVLDFLKFYILLAVPAVCTVGLQYLGVETPIFGDVGHGIQIYDVILNGAPVGTFSGVFRSSEIAAWHIGACCCFFTIVVTQRRISPTRLLLCTVVIAALLGLGILTGRRKLIVQVSVFLLAYFLLVAFIGRVGVRLWIAVTVVAAGVWLVAISLDTLVVTDVVYRQFLARGQTGFADAGARFRELGVGPILWAYERYGPLGGGVGAATSGAQNYGVNAALVAVGEGGLGKLAGELGWPGLASAIWLALTLAAYIIRTTSTIARLSPAAGRLRCGVAAFLFANFATFSVATQVFIDLFVLTTLGLFIGTLLSAGSAEDFAEEPYADGEALGAPS